MVSQREIQSRLKLVTAYQRTGSFKKAAKQENTDHRRVQRWVKRWEESGTVSDKPRCGRPRKPLNSQNATRIIKQGIKDERSACRIALQLKDEIPALRSCLDPVTVCRHLKRQNYKPMSKKKKPVLSSRHMAARLKFSKAQIRKPWANVVVTDSKYFWLCPKGRGRKIWVKQGHKPPAGKLDRNCFKVHVYGGVTKYKPSHKGRTPLFVTVGTSKLQLEGVSRGRKGVSAEVYLELLKDKLIPACKRLMERDYGSAGWVFQQDNARPHTSKIVRAWLAEQPFQKMDWPAISPDLSWIESIWSWMADALNARNDLTEENFLAAVLQTWDSIPRQVMDAQFSSIRGKGNGKGRLPECIAARGGSTRF